ncbi:MAG TPA: hypothetical protein PKX87_05790 [Alphaproteobacteria bacterium]|nr:hypothetical protein [Alphaproteobacteria bacterium]
MSKDNIMPRTQSAYQDVKESVKEDAQDLASNAIRYGQRLKEDGKEKVGEMARSVQNQIEDWKKTGSDQIERMSEQVKSNPVQSVALAFGAGLLASFFLRRR